MRRAPVARRDRAHHGEIRCRLVAGSIVFKLPSTLSLCSLTICRCGWNHPYRNRRGRESIFRAATTFD